MASAHGRRGDVTGRKFTLILLLCFTALALAFSSQCLLLPASSAEENRGGATGGSGTGPNDASLPLPQPPPAQQQQSLAAATATVIIPEIHSTIKVTQPLQEPTPVPSPASVAQRHQPELPTPVAILHGKGGNDGKLAAAVDEAAAAALKPLPLTAAERSGDSPTASEKPRELDAPRGKEAAAKGEVPLVAENPNEKSRGACPSSHGIVPSATPIPVSLYSLSHFGLLFMRLQQTGQQQQEPFAEKVAATTEKYFRQYLDHLAPRVTTFDQRFFVNDGFYNGTVRSGDDKVLLSKNILFVGGPSALRSDIVVNEALPHVEVAKKLGARLWALEHRFYGTSAPIGGASLHNLNWMNGAQALEDIAFFIRSKNAEMVRGMNTSAGEPLPRIKWTLFSHSTPLALWFCQKYGDFCSGVVASSAAAVPQLSFFYYQRHVEEAFSAVGGAECSARAAAIVLKTRQLAQSEEGRDELTRVLRLEPSFNKLPLGESDFGHFFALVATPFQAAVHHNDIPSLGIAQACKLLTAPEFSGAGAVDGELRALGALLDMYALRSWSGSGSVGEFTISYPAAVEKLRRGERGPDEVGHPQRNGRLWLWQSCNEFGLAPTSDYGGGWFGASIPNNFYLNLCADVFGDQFDIENLKSGIRHTVQHFGPGIYGGRNAVITSGSLDPWRSVRVHDAVHGETVQFVEYAGASHAADFLPLEATSKGDGDGGGEKKGDGCPGGEQPPPNSDLVSARKLFHTKVEQWFLEPELHPLTGKSQLGVNSTTNNEDQDRNSPFPGANFEDFEKGKGETSIFFSHNGREHRRPTIANWEARIEFEPKAVDVQADLESLFSRFNAQQRGQSDEESQPPLRRRLSFTEQMEQKLVEMLVADNKSASERTRVAAEARVQRGKIFQDLDHFTAPPPSPSKPVGEKDEGGNGTEVEVGRAGPNKWIQYFYRNDQYRKPGGPAFLEIGGEGAISSHWVLGHWQVSGVWAQRFGADLFALEHRFYGESQPTGASNFSVEALRYLTAEQALADTAVFIRNMNARFNYSHWVVFGGSYAGNLAAWFREKYPELAVGAIASSAPVLAQVDFFEYKQVVQNAVKLYGTEGCADNIRKFFALLQKAYVSARGRKAVATALKLCDDGDAVGWHGNASFVDDHDLWNVGDNFGDNSLSGVVQYDDQDHRRLLRHCKKFETISDFELPSHHSSIQWDSVESLLVKMAKSLGMHGEEGGKKCQRMIYREQIDYRRDITAGGYRTWFWQTCNEYGYFQSTNSGRNIFEAAIPINLQVDMCTDVFGPQFDRDYLEGRVAAVNDLYGGREHFNGTNVVFLNGSEDPWHYLSLVDPADVPHPSVRVAIADGTSHCQDMLTEREEDVPQLKHARSIATKALVEWLEAPALKA